MAKKDWKEKWCPHCRCQAGKENLPLKYEVIIKDIKTKKEKVIDKVCGNCVDNIGFCDPIYD